MLEELGFPDVHGLHERDVLDALGDVETEETKAAVVAGGLHLLEVVKSEEVLKGLLRLIARYGSAEDADRLERLLTTAPLTESVKRTGKAWLRDLRQRHR